MTEKILLLPSANGTELIRMMARFHKNTLGLRIMNAAEFARLALMRSGIVLKESFLPRRQEPAVIDGFVREVPYFASAGYADSEKIADALYNLRSLIAENEYEKLHKTLPLGEFPDKNNSLLAVYDRYLAALKDSNSIDTIGLLQKALSEARPFSCLVCTLQEYPLSPLEQALLARLAPMQSHSTLATLLGMDTKSLQNIDYTESYGASNEVEAIYDYIASNNLPFDQCIVAVADPATYAQLFYDFSQSKNLPITLGCGIPILNSNPARLLKLLYDWNTRGYHGVDALAALLHSDALDQKKFLDALGLQYTWQLDRIIRIAGQLRLSFDVAQNDRKIAALPRNDKNESFYPYVSALSRELAQGEINFLKKYVLIRNETNDRVDRSALSVICDTLEAYNKFAGGNSSDQIISALLQRSVCSENSQEGALFVTGISGALASMRQHLFVAGMSASNFPGAPRENYLLLDSDYMLFGDEELAPTSTKLVQQKKDTLEHLLAVASALGVHIHISYSCYDLANLKVENPSSVLFDIFNQQHNNAATLQAYRESFRSVGYFDQNVSSDYTIGRAYIQEKEISFEPPDLSEAHYPCANATEFSPSVLTTFFECPRKFFLTNILGVPKAEEDDPFTVMDSREIGHLAHKLMEELFHAPCDRDIFLQRAEAAFDEALKSRPPLHKDAAAAEKLVFHKMMANAYDQDPGNEVLAAEEEQHFTHSSGIRLKGYPDRVEKNPSGEYIIVDYKSGKSVKHKDHDIDSCLQVVIYAYLMEQHHIPITHCEYRYLRDNVTIFCRYDDAMKAKLDDKLNTFKAALDTGDFPCATDNDTCQYCELANICGKDIQKEEEEAE